MSHANAALTPRAPAAARAGWSSTTAGRSPGPPSSSTCPGRPPSGGPSATGAMGEAGMVDRSSAPAPGAEPDPAAAGPQDRAPALEAPAGAGRDRREAGMPASTVHAVLVRCRLNRLTHLDRRTGEADPPLRARRPGTLIHVDVKKLGNIPDGGGWRYVGRAARRPEPGRDPPDKSTQSKYRQPLIGTAFVHTVIDDHSRVAYAEIHDDETAATAAAVLRNAVAWFAARGVTVDGSCPTTAAPTAPTSGATPAPSSASPRRRPAPTGRRPTARSNASTAPSPTAGPSRRFYPQRPPAAPPCQHGSTSTTTTGPTPRSARSHPSPD